MRVTEKKQVRVFDVWKRKVREEKPFERCRFSEYCVKFAITEKYYLISPVAEAATVVLPDFIASNASFARRCASAERFGF